MIGVLQFLLSSIGVDYKTAETGEMGLALANEYKPDLILLDRKLPDTSGEKICQVLKSDSELKHIPRVVLSSHIFTDQEWTRWQESGAQAYLDKSTGPQELLAFLKKYLGI